jgi:alginate O-acetyltransferase complex protein AlgI
MDFITHNSYPPWAYMWLFASSIFAFGKILVLIKAPKKPVGWRLFAFLFLWVGMSEKNWLLPIEQPAKTTHTLFNAFLKIMVGCALMWLFASQFLQPLVAAWCGMIGLMFVLHFGLFDLLALFWRDIGIPVKPIMDAPIAATSLSNFWGQRWNLAFRDLTHQFIFKPIARRLGAKLGLWISFIVSGFVHELLISVPANAGYGLPTCYFLLQATGITLERQIFTQTLSNESPVLKWFFTHAFTLLPIFLLFPPVFVERVVIPFFQLIGVLP